MSKKIFAINAGSSSLKFQLLSMPDESLLVKGIFEKIGLKEGIFKIEFEGQKEKELLAIPSHQFAVDYLLNFLLERKLIASLDEIDGVGHRVAHGGESFDDSALIDEQVLSIIEKLSFLAPSHNPVNLVGIRAFQKALPETGIWEGQGETAERLKIINCHLGNGASICAIKNGQSVNTSMGFTPLAGLMMGSRSGDIDPMILPFLLEQEKLSAQQLSDVLNKESGLLAISQLSNDLRDVLEACDRGDEKASLAVNMFVNRIAQTIASYITDLDGLDALVFTAGIGENSALIRSLVVQKLNCLGLSLNQAANEQGQLFIQNSQSKSKILILPTNEELMIAQDTMRLLDFK